MSKSVCELQREEIERLRLQVIQVADEISKQIEVNCNLSRVLSWLTEDRFREFAEKDNWHRVICDYLESDESGA